jgi:hypothetical protein
VVVHKGEAVSVTRNDQKLPAKQYTYYGMDVLFSDIEEMMAVKKKEGKRLYARGLFDPEDGHVVQFILRVMGSRERVEIALEDFEELPAARPAPAGSIPKQEKQVEK